MLFKVVLTAQNSIVIFLKMKTECVILTVEKTQQ